MSMSIKKLSNCSTLTGHRSGVAAASAGILTRSYFFNQYYSYERKSTFLSQKNIYVSFAVLRNAFGKLQVGGFVTHYIRHTNAASITAALCYIVYIDNLY